MSMVLSIMAKILNSELMIISNYKNVFAKSYTPNWSVEVFVINKVKCTVPRTCTISDLNVEKIVGTFYENELQEADQKEFRIEKAFKRKRKRLYFKWKGYDNSFNSSINMKDIV